LKTMTERYQHGSIRRVRRVKGFAWEFRYYADEREFPTNAPACNSVGYVLLGKLLELGAWAFTRYATRIDPGWIQPASHLG
jgi:hypothetical protein